MGLTVAGCAFAVPVWQLVEQHGSEAQNHFLRRLLLATSASSTDSANPGSSASSTTSSTSASNTSNILSPSSSNSAAAAAAPPAHQLPLYRNLLTSEVKRLLTSDPYGAEKISTTIQAGLNDPAAATADTFKSIDLRQLVTERLTLTPVEKAILLLELSQLALSDSIYGIRSASHGATTKRRELGSTAAKLLRSEETLDRFVEQFELIRPTPQHASKLLSIIASDIVLKTDAYEAEIAALKPGYEPLVELRYVKAFVRTFEALFGAEVASQVLRDACSGRQQIR